MATSCGRSNGENCGKHCPHLLAGAALGGEQHDVGAGMAQQHPHQLRAGIAGGAEDADLRFAWP